MGLLLFNPPQIKKVKPLAVSVRWGLCEPNYIGIIEKSHFCLGHNFLLPRQAINYVAKGQSKIATFLVDNFEMPNGIVVFGLASETYNT